MTPTTKRDDIQGLRALAVVAVVLYHFGVFPFSGGFVGVDVFFVISGYLITAKIAREASGGRFSFRDFCAGRARRLLPALLATITATFVVAALLFSPLDFQRHSAATIAAVAGLSNMLFWHEAGYFDAAAILKPLLHTWSLAVELQFYLIWPFIVLLMLRWRLTSALALFVLAGFGAAVVMMAHDPAAAFFMTPFRMWEFAAGGLVYTVERKGLRLPQTIATVIYLIALGAVLYPVFALASNSPFPGWNAVLPVAGTAAMIWVGPFTPASKALQVWPSRWLGEISYSVYLVHWPLVVFVQYALVRPLTGVDVTILLGATLALSMVLYYLVEQPLRRPWTGRLSPRMILPVAACLIIAPASNSWSSGGWTWRVPSEIRTINEIDIEEMKAYVWERHEALKEKGFDDDDAKKVLVIGDSMSADLVNMLFEASLVTDDISLRTIRLSQHCAALYIPPEDRERFWKQENDFTAGRHTAINGCMQAQDDVFSSSLLPDADLVLIAHYWRPWALPYITGTLDWLKERTAADIRVFGRKDLLRGSIELVNERGTLVGLDEFAALHRDPETEHINSSFANMLGKHFVDMMPIICPTVTRCTVIVEGAATFWDKSHLTPTGAAVFGQRLAEGHGFPTMK